MHTSSCKSILKPLWSYNARTSSTIDILSDTSVAPLALHVLVQVGRRGLPPNAVQGHLTPQCKLAALSLCSLYTESFEQAVVDGLSPQQRPTNATWA